MFRYRNGAHLAVTTTSPLTNEHDRQTTTAELQSALNLRSTNVLIIGARETDVADVRAGIADPVTLIADGGVHELGGTCLIPNAVLLTREQQDVLRRRLDERPVLRLVSLSPVPLYPFVESGQFDETLYYRLNTITVDWIAE